MPDYGGEDPYCEPDTARGTKTLHFTEYQWPDGLRLYRYDDGSIKIAWNSYQAKVTSVQNRKQGQPGGHVIVESAHSRRPAQLVRKFTRFSREPAALRNYSAPNHDR